MKPRRALRALGNGMLGRAAPRAAAAYIRLVYRSTRWKWEGREHLQAVIDEESSVIYAFWHSRILMMCPRMEESPLSIRVLISNNRDGEVISGVVRRFGQDTIRGSTRNPKKTHQKGGGAAVLSMLTHLKSGGSGALTPDGPRGPRGTAQLGVSILAAQSGLPVIPLSYSTNRGKTLRTWDQFLLALPFGRGVYVCGAPIAPPAMDDAAIEAHRLEVEKTLTRLMHQADAMVGRRDADA